MSEKEILIERQYGQLCAALVKNGRVQSLYVDPADKTPCWGDIYTGTVTRLDPGLDAAFVDIGDKQTGLLKAKDVRIHGLEDKHSRSGISSLLSAGDRVIVQISAAGNAQGKAPKLTMDIALRGRFLVHTPLSAQVTVSRRIEKKELLNLASRIEEHEGGWIIRAAAVKVALDLVTDEAQALGKLWKSIKDRLLPADPHLVFSGPNAAQRLLCDYPDVEVIEIAEKNPDRSLQVWCTQFSPDLSEKIKITKENLFEIRDINSQISELTRPVVPLDDGASLIIETTQALTSIDVNSGNQRDFFKLNLCALKEAARQIRLRNLCGIIMLDFINLPHKADRDRLAEETDAILRQDPAGAQFHGLTRTGMAEITRTRRLPTLIESLSPQFLKTI